MSAEARLLFLARQGPLERLNSAVNTLTEQLTAIQTDFGAAIVQQNRATRNLDTLTDGVNRLSLIHI